MAVARSWASYEDTTCVVPVPPGLHILTVRQVYLNIVLDDALEEKAGGEKSRIGMVVIRGNSVVMIEVRSLIY
jgi:acyl-CoA synthetase (AMP-forming)/AMP-acid ligase II